MTTVSQVMTRGVRTMTPDENLVQAARAMDELDVGVIPVCEGDQLVGVVTDRDIVVRAIANDCSPQRTTLRDVMSAEAHWCFVDESVDEVAKLMQRLQIRRLPVLDHERHLVGIVSLGDLSVHGGAAVAQTASRTLEAISEPSRPDPSGMEAARGATAQDPAGPVHTTTTSTESSAALGSGRGAGGIDARGEADDGDPGPGGGRPTAHATADGAGSMAGEDTDLTTAESLGSGAADDPTGPHGATARASGDEAALGGLPDDRLALEEGLNDADDVDDDPDAATAPIASDADFDADHTAARGDAHGSGQSTPSSSHLGGTGDVGTLAGQGGSGYGPGPLAGDGSGPRRR